MEQLPTVLTIRRAAMPELPERFAGDDVRFAPEFARLMIERFTHPGECVLDPFAGYGTTLSAARELGRECVGAAARGIHARTARPARMRVLSRCTASVRTCAAPHRLCAHVATVHGAQRSSRVSVCRLCGDRRGLRPVHGGYRRGVPPAARVYASGRVCRRRSQQHNQRRTVHAARMGRRSCDRRRAAAGAGADTGLARRAARTRIRLWV